MTDDDILSSDATALVAALRDGRVGAAQVAEAHLTRVTVREPSVKAWAYLDPEAARARADDAARGPLYGLPIGIKDVILTRDMPTAYNSDLYADYAPPIDAACVALLRQSGAVALGKTATVELASIGRSPETCNPHDLARTPGGSSSGSAAAVADGHVPLALGTQTGGSIIRPASFCGVWALKPTWGLVPTEGAKPFAPSLDTIGWFARSARDLALPLATLAPVAGPPVDPVDLARARIGVWRTAGWPRAEAATRDALDTAIARLRAAGVTVVEIDFPFPGLAEAQRTVMFAEGARSFLAEYRAAPDKLHPRIADMVRTGGASAADLAAAYDLAATARVAFDRLGTDFDASLAPSTIAEAPLGLESTGDLLFNGLFTLLLVPCVNLPLFRAANGLPVGLTLTGPRFADRRVIAVAEAIAA